MSQLLKSLRTLKKDVSALQKKNQELQEDLVEARESAENASQPKKGGRGGPSTKKLQEKVASLRAQVKDLEQVWVYVLVYPASDIQRLMILIQQRSRDRKKIAKVCVRRAKLCVVVLLSNRSFELQRSNAMQTTCKTGLILKLVTLHTKCARYAI